MIGKIVMHPWENLSIPRSKKTELLISLSEIDEHTYGEDLGPTLKTVSMYDAMIYTCSSRRLERKVTAFIYARRC